MKRKCPVCGKRWSEGEQQFVIDVRHPLLRARYLYKLVVMHRPNESCVDFIPRAV